MKAATCDLATLGARMKAAREALGLTQVAFHEQYGYGSVRSYQKNEAGTNEAGMCLAEAFVRAGINANWLLTGEGPMLLAELAPKPTPAPQINVEALAVMLEAARMAHPKAAPARHAELAARFYAMSVDNGTVSETDIHPPGVADAA
jgi:hypothetical protein